MARGVSLSRRVIVPMATVSIAIAACAPGSAVTTRSCPETISTSDLTLQQSYAEFKRTIESGPFARHLDQPLACEARVDDGSIRLVYQSSKGDKLEAQRERAIEATETRLTSRGLSENTGLALLQRTEHWAFGEKGCSIAWQKAPDREAGSTPDSRELVYRGDDCSCQGRLVYSGNSLIGLIFRSAC
jgi:hypothetical protein